MIPSVDIPQCVGFDEALNLYFDGELPYEAQPRLFVHIATCDPCRLQFNTLLAFRESVQAERLSVPPVVDEQIMSRLDRRKGMPRIRNRRLDRPTLWQPQAKLPYQVTALMVGIALLFGILYFTEVQRNQHLAFDAPLLPVHQVIEAPRPVPPAPQALQVDQVYVFYPGLTVVD